VVPNPGARDMFQLNDLASYRQFSTVKNFEIFGHSYFRGPWLVPGAPGAGFNTMRICGTIAYFAGYNPALFGALIVDVGNPASMEPLSFIAGNPGTRNAYLRVDCDRKILALGHSASPENPNKPTGGTAVRSVGASVFDKLFAVRFAPDGRRLVFAAVGQPQDPASRSLGGLRPLGLLGLVRPSLAHANGDLWELWTVDVDGRNLRAITSLGEDLPVAAWSPDGRHVAFLGGGSARSAEVGLTVMGADGSRALRLTAQPGHRGLDWARDRP
jgi:WD40-like Beta Propeller Repeat